MTEPKPLTYKALQGLTENSWPNTTMYCMWLAVKKTEIREIKNG